MMNIMMTGLRVVIRFGHLKGVDSSSMNCLFDCLWRSLHR